MKNYYFKILVACFLVLTSTLLHSQTYTGDNLGSAITGDTPEVNSEANVDLTGSIGVDYVIESVLINANHTWSADLEFTLISPSGTTLDLSSDNGGGAEDSYLDTVFQDGGEDITSAETPFTGVYEPEGGTFVATFDAESIDGVWTLNVVDNYPSLDDGTLNNFEITFGLPPTCVTPLNLSVANVTATTADLSWDEETTAVDGYEYVLITDGSTPDETTTPTGSVADASTTTTMIDNLMPITDYAVYVRSVCDSASGDVSSWTSSVTFTTECSVVVPDYSEGFTNVVPDCWEEADDGDPSTGPTEFGSSSWYDSSYINNSSNSNAATINLYTDTRSDWLITPTFDLSAGGYEVVFKVALTDFNDSFFTPMGSDDEVQFLYSEDGGTTWTALKTWANGSEPSETGDYENFDLSSITGTEVRFAFWATEGTVDDPEDVEFFIDDFEVRTPPSCPEPLNVSVSGVTATTADLSWNEEAIAVDGYEYVLITDGSVPDDTTTPTGSVTGAATTSTTLENLMPETDYVVYVRSVCDAASGDLSSWSSAVNFATGVEATMVSAGNPALGTYCYDNSEFIEWRYDSDDSSPLVLIFSAGSLEESFSGTWDDLIIYDGIDATGTVLFDSDDDGSILEGLSFTAASGSLYMTLDSDGSVSCQSEPDIDTIEFGVYVEGDEPVASIQVIHNSADPAAEFVDVYINGVLEIDDFEFRTATPFIDLPASVSLDIDIAPGNSSDVSESVYNVNLMLPADETFVAVASGVLDPSQFDESVNTIAFDLDIFAGGQQASTNPGETSLLVYHGSTDAPTVDVRETSVPVGIVVDDISYTEFQGYLDLINDDYEINVELGDNSAVVQSYEVPLQTLGLADLAITVLASGFLDPSNNQSGAGFGLWVALPSGGALVPLDETLSTTNFDDNNFSFYPNPTQGRISLETTGQVESIKVFNILGQEMMSETPNSVSPSLNVGSLQSGTYIMNVTIDGTSSNFRFIKK